MLIRPILSNNIQYFRGKENKADNQIGKAIVDNSQELFREQERIAQTSEFLDYLLHNEIDITTLEHSEKKAKLLEQSYNLLKNGVKKIKK